MGAKMKKKIEKHHLSKKPTIEYIIDNLSAGMTLSQELVQCIDFATGHFYTLLPTNAHPNQIHKFDQMGLLKQPPVVTTPSGSYSAIPNIQLEFYDN